MGSLTNMRINTAMIYKMTCDDMPLYHSCHKYAA